MNLCELLEMLHGDVKDYCIWIPAHKVLIELSEFLHYDYYHIRFKRVESICKNGNSIQINLEDF